MPALPSSGNPRHAAPTTPDPESTQSILADDRMLDDVSRGAYAGDDPVGRLLQAQRDASIDQARPQADSGGYVDPLERLALYLIGAATLTAFAGAVVIALISTAIGLLLMAMAASWGGVAAVIVQQTGWPR